MADEKIYKIVGGRKAEGEVSCSGAKNFASKAMVAALLTSEACEFSNVPNIGEIEIALKLIEKSGAQVSFEDNKVKIQAKELNNHIITMPDSRTNRLPIILLNALLVRFGRGQVPFVGGDAIGARKLDFHIEILKNFGVILVEKDQHYYAEVVDQLRGCHIKLPYPSVGATETALLMAVLAKGTTVITNIAIEPEVIELITMLQMMGAIILMDSYRKVVIHGVEKLCGTKYKIIGDRIEAGSWACLACATDGEVLVKGVRPAHMGNFLAHFQRIGGGFVLEEEDTIRFFRKRREIQPVVMETEVFPGFSTDWQQPFTVMLTQAHGISVIHETVYEQRFGYLEVLNQLGAVTQVSNHCLGHLNCRYQGFDFAHSALIIGPKKLKAIDTMIEVPDIRAGLAYVIAASLAEGTTVLSHVDRIERGYEKVKEKLQNLNIFIQ